MRRIVVLFYLLLVVLAGTIWFLPETQGLSADGRYTLILILTAIFLWTSEILPHAYTTFFLFVCFILMDIATANELFSFFLTPLVWMIVGSYLISHAIRKSGLAERIAYYFTLKFVNSYTSLIAFIFFLGFILSIFIPHPFPRVFLMISIVNYMINNTDMDETMKRYVGFSVFVGVTVTGTILLTGDTLLNGSAFTLAGANISWWEWFKLMSVPGIFISALTLLSFLFIFRQRTSFTINKTKLKQQLDSMGSFSPAEWKVSIWVGLSLLLWITESFHHINPAWVALLSATGLALPKVGDLLNEEDISKNINWNIILFIVGALSIGRIGYKTGVSSWVLNLLTPDNIPNDLLFAIITIVFLSAIVHMLIGSASATMSLIIPPIIQMFPQLNSLTVSLIVYSTVAFHYFLPYHSVVILLGSGKTGYFSDRDVLKFGIPLTIILLITTLIVQPLWWKFVNFL